MVIIDTPDEVCVCEGKLVFVREAPNRVTARFAPQDEIWSCKICGKYFIKTWRPEHIDYYTENADYDAHFDEIKSNRRFCAFCNADRRSENPVILKQPVCKKCCIIKEWEDRFHRGEVTRKAPSDSELSDFLDGETALESRAYQEAFNKFKPFAEMGFSFAEFHMGEINENAPPPLNNPEVALEWYKKAALKRFPNAFFRIGKLFADNQNVGINLVEAYKWLNLGVYFGDFTSFSARDAVAKKMSYEDVLKAQEESNFELKKSWKAHDFRKRIFDNLKELNGEQQASIKFARMLDGAAFPMFLLDYKESERMYRRMADDGFPPAMSELGEKLALGRGVPKNLDEAAQWLLKAISRKYFQAAEFAWNEIVTGSELKIDQDLLKTCFLTEIEAGNPRAMYAWGVINQNGRGVSVDLVEAHKWFNLAQYFGEALPQQNPMETIERRIPHEQLEKAQNDALDWLEAHEGKNQSIRKFSKYFRERIMTAGAKKWFKIGEFFEYGSPGFLRNLVLAYGCFDLALRGGDISAQPRLAYLGKLIPPAVAESAARIVMAMEKTGRVRG